MNAPLDLDLADLSWLEQSADDYNQGRIDADTLLPRLGASGLLRIGVPKDLGGSGGQTFDAVEAIAGVAEKSLTAAFVFWGQRTFIEYLLQSPNAELRTRLLPTLLEGTLAGATGLSNAMKFLSGIETLQIQARPHGTGWRLDGRLPWVTNLRKAGFVVAAAVDIDGGQPAIVALNATSSGLRRSDDLDLLALRGSNTAAIDLEGVEIGAEALIHDNARAFCPAVRPAFLSLQLGMSIGLARIALRAAAAQGQGAHRILLPRIGALQAELDTLVTTIEEGLRDARFVAEPSALFRIRIRLAQLVQAALDLELNASGGRAYLLNLNRDFARRWQEGAFIPVITPSLTQLEGELAKQAGACHA